MDRRKFISTSAVAAAGAILSSVPGVAKAMSTTGNKGPKKRIALIGTGSRGTSMWGIDVIKDYSDYVEYVGLCDINPGRVEAAKKYMGTTCKTFTDFETMMKEVKPDILIVTVMDSLHDKYIIRGMELGCDVISEKPMTTDEVKCQTILDAQKRTGKKLIVTFNYRYSPHRAKIWELIRKGEIGEITSVDFHWYLDTSHGADYFRRWHRKREFSGSLWLHKASHHFDLLNWWIDSEPGRSFCLRKSRFLWQKRQTTCCKLPHLQS